MAVDWKFINKLEGPCLSLTGYVPCRNGVPIGSSGVTIGYGVDLGWQGEREISAWPESVKDKVRPYLLLHGEDAVNKLRESPLSITQDEAEKIQTAMEAACEARCKRAYERSCNRVCETVCENAWESVPACVQTVICSLGWQFYDVWKQKTLSKVWTAAVGKNWSKLPRLVRECGPAGYTKRRNAEALYIVRGLK